MKKLIAAMLAALCLAACATSDGGIVGSGYGIDCTRTPEHADCKGKAQR